LIPSDDDVREAATRFKTALDAIDLIHWDRLHIGNYPRGACGHCAELLARYLTEQFGITPEYVCRDFHDDAGDWLTGHAWLEWNGLLIDISGDQFGWPPVIVTRASPYHGVASDDDMRHLIYDDPDWWRRQCADIWAAAKRLLTND